MTTDKTTRIADAQIDEIFLRYNNPKLKTITCHRREFLLVARDVLALQPAPSTQEPADAHEQTAAAMAADNCEMWRNACEALRAEVKQLHAYLDASVGMLAAWCVAVDMGGSEWDYWDEHYKDAMYRPGPLRSLLDTAIAAERSAGAEGGAA